MFGLVWMLAIALADPSPTVDWQGLTLGQSPAAAIDAWIAARGLTCPAAPSPRRTTQQHRCAGAGPLEGQLPVDRLLLARLDDGPLHHVSTSRETPDAAAAKAEYEAAVARLSSRYGQPQVANAVGRMDAPMIRYRTAWSFDDLAVELSLTRFSGVNYVVSERYDVPGAEGRADTRPGSTNPHGDAPAPRRNPHISP
jgi:hypothetical protein